MTRRGAAGAPGNAVLVMCFVYVFPSFRGFGIYIYICSVLRLGRVWRRDACVQNAAVAALVTKVLFIPAVGR